MKHPDVSRKTQYKDINIRTIKILKRARVLRRFSVKTRACFRMFIVLILMSLYWVFRDTSGCLKFRQYYTVQLKWVGLNLETHHFIIIIWKENKFIRQQLVHFSLLFHILKFTRFTPARPWWVLPSETCIHPPCSSSVHWNHCKEIHPRWPTPDLRTTAVLLPVKNEKCLLRYNPVMF